MPVRTVSLRRGGKRAVSYKKLFKMLIDLDINFYVDLVFYNRLLRCYVLIDLKIDKLTHQDLGQMQMYVNYYDRYQKLPDENPTIGILLCKEKNDAIVRMTLPENSNIFASEYSLYLPDKKLLQKKLQEWIEEETGGEDK